MTKEEAKLVLDNARPQTKEIDRQFYDDEDLNNALDMAIKALEQQSEDCVSRQAIINMTGLSNWFESDDDYNNFVWELGKLPPVTPTQSWLPVSEKLPEESGNYLLYGKVVDYEENCVFFGEYDSDYEKFGYEENIYDSETLGFLDSEFCEYNKVIAWQPLPEPYEEKSGSECDRCEQYELCLETYPPLNLIEIPKGATNGDMIKAMFPNVYSEECDYDIFTTLDGDTRFTYDWWNEPYQGD